MTIGALGPGGDGFAYVRFAVSGGLVVALGPKTQAFQQSWLISGLRQVSIADTGLFAGYITLFIFITQVPRQWYPFNINGESQSFGHIIVTVTHRCTIIQSLRILCILPEPPAGLAPKSSFTLA
jgi:hypothetical protein